MFILGWFGLGVIYFIEWVLCGFVFVVVWVVELICVLCCLIFVCLGDSLLFLLEYVIKSYGY